MGSEGFSGRSSPAMPLNEQGDAKVNIHGGACLKPVNPRATVSTRDPAFIKGQTPGALKNVFL